MHWVYTDIEVCVFESRILCVSNYLHHSWSEKSSWFLHFTSLSTFLCPSRLLISIHFHKYEHRFGWNFSYHSKKTLSTFRCSSDCSNQLAPTLYSYGCIHHWYNIVTQCCELVLTGVEYTLQAGFRDCANEWHINVKQWLSGGKKTNSEVASDNVVLPRFVVLEIKFAWTNLKWSLKYEGLAVKWMKNVLESMW